jgi:hypothetical protein
MEMVIYMGPLQILFIVMLIILAVLKLADVLEDIIEDCLDLIDKKLSQKERL